MRVIALEEAPIHQVSYRTVGAGGRVVFTSAPVVVARVDALSEGLEAVIVTSDLQGVAPVDSGEAPPALAGVLVAEDMALLCAGGDIPPAERTGVILAGDLYARAALDRRGGRGDARPVWRAFAERFRWVVGVPGNHDGYGATVEEARAFQSEPGIHLLDGATVHLDGLDIAGLGGIVGNPRRDHRRALETFVAEADRLIATQPDLLLFHEGPQGPGPDQPGHPVLTQHLAHRADPLIVCGHNHWDAPLAELESGLQVLNVDARVVVLVCDAPRRSSTITHPHRP